MHVRTMGARFGERIVGAHVLADATTGAAVVAVGTDTVCIGGGQLGRRFVDDFVNFTGRKVAANGQ